MASWFWLVIRDVWIGDEQSVAGRFDMPAVHRITCVVLACMTVPSGLLWTHYKGADSYGPPLEPFFATVFTLSSTLAGVLIVPAVF